jgi:hypothetical protein
VVAGLRLGWESVRAEPGHRDDVPLEALGGVHGQDLDRAIYYFDLARRQPPLLLLGGGRVGEERRQGATFGFLREPGRHITDRVQVRPSQSCGCRATGPYRHFDVQTDGLGDVGDEVRQRLVEPGPQRAQFVPAQLQSPVTLRRERSGRRP